MAYGLAFQNSVLNMLIFAAKHAALGELLALISFQHAEETMLAMRAIDLTRRASDPSTGD